MLCVPRASARRPHAGIVQPRGARVFECSKPFYWLLISEHEGSEHFLPRVIGSRKTFTASKAIGGELPVVLARKLARVVIFVSSPGKLWLRTKKSPSFPMRPTIASSNPRWPAGLTRSSPETAPCYYSEGVAENESSRLRSTLRETRAGQSRVAMLPRDVNNG